MTKEPALERRWMFYYALGKALEIGYHHQKRDLSSDLRKLGNPAWTRKGGGDQERKSIATLSKLAFRGMIDAYKQASANATFTHRNWFRSQTTLEAIATQIENSWELLSDHADEYLLVRH